MPNTYFQFKQFTVHQEHCAMKVCTDACLLGAIAASYFASLEELEDNVLDIGSGTGLLSLMLAQQMKASIDAIEINKDAYLQSLFNFKQSPWPQQFTIFNDDVLHFTTQKKYRFIICNPPFYDDNLLSPDENKNAAKHDTTLQLPQLCTLIKKLLSENGIFALLLPYQQVKNFIAFAASKKIYLQREILIRHSMLHPFFRAVLFFSEKKEDRLIEEFCIKNEDGHYTAQFTRLLKPYYLHL